MNEIQHRVAQVVDVRTTADGARLGRWLMGFQGVVLASTGWWVESSDDVPLRALALGAVLVLLAALSTPLPWGRWRPRALGLYPLAAFCVLGLLGLLAPAAATAYAGFLTLWFMFVGVVGPMRSGLKLLAPAVLTWLSIQGSLGSEQVVRLVIAALIWVTLADVLAMRASAHRDRAARLAQQAETDPLTQLPNRRALETSLRRLKAGDVVVVVDLDHFKELNDRGGHAFGDTVLVDFAHTLASVVRGSDLVARYGGEEFVLVLPQNDTAGLGAASVVARLRLRWAQLHPDITWSAGASCHVEGAEPADTLAEADRALYRAKADGRDRVVASGDFRELVGVATAVAR
ncbi:hypothetical protein GCM10027446_29210 [Angustibacter peucedani]